MMQLSRIHGKGSMKVHQLTRGLWEKEASLTLGCKRLRPLAPKLHNHSVTPLDLKSFIRPDSGPRKPPSSHLHITPDSPPQVETHPGGTRWNPTQEQIGILEMLYRGGMRTPNALQIEQITAQLAKYGKIEGKNVFYWFQNHKARERQKLKRITASATPPHPIPTSPIHTITNITLHTQGGEVETGEDNPLRKKCRSWGFQCLESESRLLCKEVEVEHKTLELFPLHPEGK